MGLLKTIEHENTGVMVTYWHVASIHVTKEYNAFIFYGFTSKAARDAGKKEFTTITLDYFGLDRPLTKETLILGDNLTLVYNKVVEEVPATNMLTSRFFVGCAED